MRHIEYKTELHYPGSGCSELEHLNNLGKDGWELVSEEVITRAHSVKQIVSWLMKRISEVDNPFRVWQIGGRDCPPNETVYTTVEDAKHFVESVLEGGWWLESDAHGTVWYYCPAGTARETRDAAWLYYVIPLNIRTHFFMVREGEVQRHLKSGGGIGSG